MSKNSLILLVIVSTLLIILTGISALYVSRSDIASAPEMPAFTEPGPPDIEPHAEDDPFADVDRALSRLELGNIAFNAPPEMGLDENVIVHLTLGVSAAFEELRQAIEGPGPVRERRVKISNEMFAVLGGADFKIEELSDRNQAVSRNRITEWKWAVKPLRPGTHRLWLRLSAKVNVGDSSAFVTLKTFEESIDVRVTLGQRVTNFVSKNWQFIAGVIVIPLIGWAWKRRNRQKPN